MEKYLTIMDYSDGSISIRKLTESQYQRYLDDEEELLHEDFGCHSDEVSTMITSFYPKIFGE